MVNEMKLIGRLTKDVVFKTAANGKAVAEFSVAFNHSKKEKDASFFNVQVWEKTAEFCRDHLEKGKEVFISGQMKQQKWTKDGKNYEKWVLEAWLVKPFESFESFKEEGFPEL